jgi:hypothetical protein
MANTLNPIGPASALRPQQAPNRFGAVPALRPLENCQEAVVFEVHEEVLQRIYDILLYVRLFFQDPTTRSINGINIILFQKMFMAGLGLPFPKIARDFVLFLMVAPSQIMPNAKRYLFAFHIL